MRKYVICLLLLCSALSAEDKRVLYPAIEPNQTGYLPEQGGHRIYWEESGNPNGKPILLVQGGPGIGTYPYQRSFFNPEKYRIILFDQRGCGKSLPFSELKNNTTWDLIGDIERLREHLGIKNWLVFGGSWGSTLGLSYAIQHPEAVNGLVLRGIFLCRPKEIYWYYQNGANHIFPDLWEYYVAPIPEEERGDFVRAFYKRLTSADPEVRKAAAQAWAGWEGGTSKLLFDPSLLATLTDDATADAIARIECHYFINNVFFDTDNWILENINAIRHIPCVIVQGRYDVTCPIISAWDLHRAWPEAQLEIIPDAGHVETEAGIMDALIRATDRFAD